MLLLERGQPVEQRGRDIGALFARSIINPDSNLCYGALLQWTAMVMSPPVLSLPRAKAVKT